MKSLSLATLFIFASILLVSGQDFEGSIKYKMSYSNLPKEMKDMMPEEVPESVLKIKGSKTKMEVSMMGFNNVTIFDGDAKTNTTYMDGMGQKIKSTIPIEDEEKIEIKLVEGETKRIAGYLCNKAIIKQADTPDLEVFYAKDLKSETLMSLNPAFKDLKGLPLEYQINEQGMTIMVTATEVVKKSLDNSEFDPPAGDYKEAPKMPGF